MADKKDDQPAAPLNDPKVDVQAEPKSNSNEDRREARRLTEKVKENVEKVVKKSADQGPKKAFEAADDEIDRAKDGASPKHIRKIKVRVSGTDADGDDIAHERTVKPKGD